MSTYTIGIDVHKSTAQVAVKDEEGEYVDLQRVPAHVTTVIFTVTSYRGHTFEQVSNAFCRLVDSTTNSELARYTLQGGMAFTGMVMAKVYRVNGEWKLQAIGEGIQAKHAGEAAPRSAGWVGTSGDCRRPRSLHSHQVDPKAR